MVTTAIEVYAKRRGMWCVVVLLVTIAVLVVVGGSVVGEGEARDEDVSGSADFACAEETMGSAAAGGSRAVLPILCPVRPVG